MLPTTKIFIKNILVTTAVAVAVFAFFALTHVEQAQAQNKMPATSPAVVDRGQSLPERIVRPMRAVDGITLRAEGVLIRLWGIKPARSYDSLLEAKALDFMDGLIQEQQVNCKIMGGRLPELIARCTTQSANDLSLSLLNNGFAMVDRRQTYNTVFAMSYEKAQEAARLAEKGVWAGLNANKKGENPEWMNSWMVPLSMIFGPLIGLLIIGFIARQSLKGMADSQQNENLKSQQKEAKLQSRERQVLITTLEGELSENKNKIDAFLVIYGDMLRDLKDPVEKPKYQQAGDIVQKHPNFSKIVFETNIAKLSLLDMKLAGDISKLYASLPKENEYINLDQDVPLDTATKLIEKVIKDANDFIPLIDEAITGLQASQASSFNS